MGRKQKKGLGWIPGQGPWLAMLLTLLAPVVVLGGPVSFLTSTLPAGVKGESYLSGDPAADVFLEAQEGVPPYAFSLLGGNLPAGLVLETSGRLAGSPQSCGNFVFQVQVRDALQGFSDQTFLLQVGGPSALVAPALLAGTVEAGGQAILTMDLQNQGCETLQFHLESVEGSAGMAGLSRPPEAAGNLAMLMKMGAPVPRTLGRVAGPSRTSGRGWFIDASGQLLDAEGNPASAAAEVARTGLGRPAINGARILYINVSAITGERERLEATGHTVVQALVPQALDLATLKSFDLVWLTAATDAAFPSRQALRQYVWEGGGLVITQVQVAGETPLLPPGYTLSSFPGGAAGDTRLLTFTEAAATDPLTSTLEIGDLPANFDTTSIAASGPLWNWLAVQADNPDLGSLATAVFGAGRLVYHSGNLGTSVVPGAQRGSDDFIVQVVNSAMSGLSLTSCSWLKPLVATSDARPEIKSVETVRPVDNGGGTVAVQLQVDATHLIPAVYQCDLAVLSDVLGQSEIDVPVTVTVTAPVGPRILSQSLPRSEPEVPYAVSLLVAGGTPPYAFALIQGSLPAGLSLNTADGTIFGTPSEAGQFMPGFRVTDSTGAFSESVLSLGSGFAITTQSLPDGILGRVYVAPVAVAGGVPPYRFELEPGIDIQLPAGDPSSPEAQICTTTDLGSNRLSTQCTLDTGTYRVFFTPVEGFVPPVTSDQLVSDGAETILDADYLLFGSITVNTNLVDGFYVLENSSGNSPVSLEGGGESFTFNDLPPEDYTATFRSVPGFATPAVQSGTLTEGGALSLTGEYVSVTTPMAAMRVDRSGFSVPQPAETAVSSMGFGTGTLTVITDAPGASFRIVGKRLPSLLSFFEPCAPDSDQNCTGEAGNQAALSGLMLTLDPPTLASGQRVPLTVVAQDAVGNRARKSFAPHVWLAPQPTSLSPGNVAQGQQTDLIITGPGLKASASISLGPGMSLGPLKVDRSVLNGQEFLQAVLDVDPGAAPNQRDLIYTDPALGGTTPGSVVRFPQALTVFSEVSRVDLDGSGRVDGVDLARLARQFGLHQGQAGFDPGVDLDLDGDVDGDDLLVMSIDFGRQTLKIDTSTLPPPPAVLGVEYEHRITFLGGNLFLEARKLDGNLPDGLTLTLDVGAAGGPADSALVISGIPAEVGTFTTTIQVVDAFFAIADQSLVVTVIPPPAVP